MVNGKLMITVSQNDPRWSFKTIGKSTTTIGAMGCAISCLSMASDWFGCYKDPSWMAKNLEFLIDKVLWQSIGKVLCFEFEWRFYKYDENRIKQSIADPNKVCLLNVYNRHWVVALKKVPFGYFVADPWRGTKKFYSNSSISGGTILRKK